MIDRAAYRSRIIELLDRYPVVLLLGPRQCGKTTLAREIARVRNAAYYDLEDPDSPLRPDSASFTLKPMTGLVVIDEFQRMPQLFELLRVLADRRPIPARFLILGSASLDLVKGVSESLAGRVAYMPMGGFQIPEVGTEHWRRLWTRGTFPDSFLAKDDIQSYEWRQDFIQSFLERDLPQLGITVPSPTLRRFWTMLAHWHGQIWNASDLARAMDTAPRTAKRYLDILSGAFMVRQIQPWFMNTRKRLVKSPKVYFRDSGLLHALLGLRNHDSVMSHPRLGFSWEGFAIEDILTRFRVERDAYFYKAHGGTELDLLVGSNGNRMGFEFKFASAPAVTAAMHTAIEDLGLRRLFIVHPGIDRYAVHERIEVTPLHLLTSDDLGQEPHKPG